MVQLLLHKGASLDVQNKNGITALHLASDEGHKEVAQLLLDKGAALNVQDKEGRTALHYAIENSKKEVVQLLLDMGAQVPDSLLHDPDFLAVLADFDEDQLGRVAAARVGLSFMFEASTAVLMLVRLAGGARDRARALRSSDPRGADEHQALFARLQLAAAKCTRGAAPTLGVSPAR